MKNNDGRKRLTAQQRRFVNFILKGIDGKNAYIKAGYKARGNAAKAAASRLLTNVNVSSAIEVAQKQAAYNAEITVERILREEACIAFQNAGDVFELTKGTLIKPNELPEEVQRAIAGVEVIATEVAGKKSIKYRDKFWDKGRSLERLSKHLGMYDAHNRQKAPKIEGCEFTVVRAGVESSS